MTSVLCVNVGSSSLKTALFEDMNEQLRTNVPLHSETEGELLRKAADEVHPDIVVHRIVHGGPEHDGPRVVDESLIDQLEQLTPLAPLHMPLALKTLHAARVLFADARHVACFDTAFHRTIPEVARRYALPESIAAGVVQKYGFHGLSCQHVVNTLPSEKTRKAVVAHLGSGCSVTAIADSKSVESSMGFSPTGGVLMATRPGDIDPGVLLYAIEHGVDVPSLRAALNNESGLKAITGTSSMQEVLGRTDQNAELAIEMFCRSVAQRVMASVVTLGGLDTLVFTGGIGEHAAPIRDRIEALLDPVISFEVQVVAADEERVMAEAARSCA